MGPCQGKGSSSRKDYINAGPRIWSELCAIQLASKRGTYLQMRWPSGGLPAPLSWPPATVAPPKPNPRRMPAEVAGENIAVFDHNVRAHRHRTQPPPDQ